ncbi:MAG: hypothetical protein GEV08_11400 [Acidimicrobiia bacterium]|nr:hypothetical protein [Acidimicrobiia bacterium]
MDYRELLRPLVEGRRVVLAGGPAAAHTATAGVLRQLGAEATLVLGTEGRGTGPLPEPEVAAWVATSPGPTGSVSATIHASNRLLEHPPPDILDALARFDPGREALVIGSFLNEASELDGRPFLAWRRPKWVAFEDKLIVDALWDRAGVRRAPSAVVHLDPAALRRATRSLDGGAGTVWAADTSEGFHGGAEKTRWVRSAGELDEAVAAFAGRTRRVRVMPFVAGVPCSIHGIVFPDHLAALRPVEQVTLRRAAGGGFLYAGCATFYDPPKAVRELQRDIARRVGAVLRHEVAYRGAFSIDGVVTGNSFLPTELNPRMSAGLSVMLGAVPDLPLQLLLDALVGGIDLGYRPAGLERLLLERADGRRAGGTWRIAPDGIAGRDQAPLVESRGDWRWAREGEVATGWLTCGLGAHGSFVRLNVDPGQVSRGPSFAPRAARFWSFADRELGTGLGELVPVGAPVSAG